MKTKAHTILSADATASASEDSPVFPNPAIPTPTPFHSILSLDLSDTIDPLFVHVLYGASQDLCANGLHQRTANGLRIGLVYTQNEGIMGVMSRIGISSTLENCDLRVNFGYVRFHLLIAISTVVPPDQPLQTKNPSAPETGIMSHNTPRHLKRLAWKETGF
ncbi:hypothetical protein N7492_001043 [Penicillium capsulatum]|uniref:Uncharacterized protein n=1 Tax=Penicillium capsulatum TaxID=69766 RepID=A0A9W9M0T9_9EURO|nr:hypothetical protein N7492_001043 [Penicillium capsulatum]KAJ6129898.1 hypothetical protein N7512_002678 [Penicillium capsulatum]